MKSYGVNIHLKHLQKHFHKTQNCLQCITKLNVGIFPQILIWGIPCSESDLSIIEIIFINLTF